MPYVMQRATYAASLMAATIVLSFLLFQLVPTDPARIALGANASEAQVVVLREQLGLDQSFVDQLLTYLTNLASGDLGKSFVDGRLVGGEVLNKLAVSASLTLLASLVTAAYLIMQLSYSAKGDTPLIFRLQNQFFTAMPTMFIGILALRWIVSGYPYNFYPGALLSLEAGAFLLPPALVLAFYPMGILGKVADREFKSLAARPYVLAARSRGLSDRRILWRYMFPNSLITILSSYTTLLPILLTGSFIVEIMFSVPGIGALLLKSVLNRDLPMLQGIVIISTAFTVLVNFAIELAYPAIDPRIVEREHV